MRKVISHKYRFVTKRRIPLISGPKLRPQKAFMNLKNHPASPYTAQSSSLNDGNSMWMFPKIACALLAAPIIRLTNLMRCFGVYEGTPNSRKPDVLHMRISQHNSFTITKDGRL